MARHETVNVLGIDYELQSVSPQWYFEQNDKCGMTGSGSRDTARYMDIMFKNVVTSPANVASKGLKAFEENEDIETPELLTARSNAFFDRERSPEAAQRRATRNKQFWFMLFDGDGLTYRDLKSMDMAEYYECIAAKKMFVQQLKEQQQKE